MKNIYLINTFETHTLHIRLMGLHDESINETDNPSTQDIAEDVANTISYLLTRTRSVINYTILKGISLRIIFLLIGCLLMFGSRNVSAADTSLGLSPLITYTIQQVSNNRYLDAHEVSEQDFRLVTRHAQDNGTQRWRLTPLGDDRYTIQQVSNNRFVDAHEIAGQDFRLVTRPEQANNTQKWKLIPQGNDRYTIQQVSNNRFVDAHENEGQDFRLVTRPAQNNDTQSWYIKPINIHTIQQVSNNRFVDAHENAGEDFRVVTRPPQSNNTQRWKFTHLSNNNYTIQQMINNRFVDAHEIAGQDFRLVTRPEQNNNTQRWKLTPQGNDRFTIQQVSNNRFVDAHEHAGEDFRLVTRPEQNNNTQKWKLTPATFTAKSKQITVSRHNTVALTNNRVDTILDDATMVLMDDAGSGDVSCFVTLARSDSVKVFNTGDGSINTSAELQAIFGLAGNVKVVDDVDFCEGRFNTSFIGCGRISNNSFITERFTASLEGILWAHEYGHNTGLRHRDTTNNNVMFRSIGANRTRINQTECNSFRSSSPSTAAASAGGQSPAPGKPSVKDFVSNIYFDGLPLDMAATYTANDATILLTMLKDPKQVQFHENIALTLGMIGAPKAVDPLIAFINKPIASKELRAAHKGRVGAIVALGYLVNRSKSEKALTFLKDSSISEVWKKRNIKGTSIDDITKRRRLSKYAIISLGLSGDPEGVKHLELLKDQTQIRSPTEAAFLNDIKGVMSDSIQLNRRISSDGLLKYYERKVK